MEQIGVCYICQNDNRKAAEIAGNLDLNENELAIFNTDKKIKILYLLWKNLSNIDRKKKL